MSVGIVIDHVVRLEDGGIVPINSRRKRRSLKENQKEEEVEDDSDSGG
jgi:hypothetical protein